MPLSAALREPDAAVVAVARRARLDCRLGDIETDGVSALRNAPFARALLDIGALSLHAAAPGALDRGEGLRNPVLAGLLIDYALEIVPRAPGRRRCIDVSGALDLAERLRGIFGQAPAPADLVAAVGRRAQRAVEARAAPSRGAEGA